MSTEQNYGEFGPIGHENGMPKTSETQTHHEIEAGIHPDDPESKKALIRLNKLLAEGADTEAVHAAESHLQHAVDTERIQAADTARHEISKIHDAATQSSPSTEPSTPYPVHTTNTIHNRPVPVNYAMPQQRPTLNNDSLHGKQLATQIQHDLAGRH